jgi:molecular chaperone GrpE
MTKKKDNDKRRVEIEDKRCRGEDTEGNGGVEAMDGAAVDAVLDEQLKQFTPEGQVDEVSNADTAAAVGGSVSPADLEQQAGEYLELARRREAELQNYRKRVEKDMADARRFAVESLLSDLFPSLDGLAQAIETYKDTPDGDNPLLDGVRRTIRSLESALLKHGIEKINEAPVHFDPELHQALNVEQSADVDADTTAEIYVEGYRLGDTVLKPAMVRVVKPEE